MIYRINIHEDWIRTVEVEADSAGEAINKARLDDNVKEVEFEFSEITGVCIKNVYV